MPPCSRLDRDLGFLVRDHEVGKVSPNQLLTSRNLTQPAYYSVGNELMKSATRLRFAFSYFHESKCVSLP